MIDRIVRKFVNAFLSESSTFTKYNLVSRDVLVEFYFLVSRREGYSVIIHCLLLSSLHDPYI